MDNYSELYYHLVMERGIDTDEARCLMSDIEEYLEDNPMLDAWELVEELI